MQIEIPKLSLIVLIGPSGSGKSTFARKHFLHTEVLSSDYFRGLISDDENNQAVSAEAFDALHYLAAKRLAHGKLTVIDATNVQKESRAPLVALAKKFHCLPVAIVFDLPEHVCHTRNQTRSDRAFGSHVVRQQKSQMRKNLRDLQREGFRSAFVMRSVEEADSAVVARVPLWNDRTDELGPFDIIGDVHGCADELELLLEQLGYVRGSINDGFEESLQVHDAGWGEVVYHHCSEMVICSLLGANLRSARITFTLPCPLHPASRISVAHVAISSNPVVARRRQIVRDELR